MTVRELKDTLGLTVFALPEPEREAVGGYAGDLLSWVMGRAEPGNVWLTIMSGVNVCAVALLTEVSCVLLTEGVTPDADLLRRAEEHGVNLLGTAESTFLAALRLRDLL
jgi:hypothetical protein